MSRRTHTALLAALLAVACCLRRADAVRLPASLLVAGGRPAAAEAAATATPGTSRRLLGGLSVDDARVSTGNNLLGDSAAATDSGVGSSAAASNGETSAKASFDWEPTDDEDGTESPTEGEAPDGVDPGTQALFSKDMAKLDAGTDGRRRRS